MPGHNNAASEERAQHARRKLSPTYLEFLSINIAQPHRASECSMQNAMH